MKTGSDLLRARPAPVALEHAEQPLRLQGIEAHAAFLEEETARLWNTLAHKAAVEVARRRGG